MRVWILLPPLWKACKAAYDEPSRLRSTLPDSLL